VGEEIGKAGFRMHFHDQFGQIEPRQTRIDRGAQRDEARRFLDLFQAIEGQVRAFRGIDDGDGRVQRDTIGGFPIGSV